MTEEALLKVPKKGNGEPIEFRLLQLMSESTSLDDYVGKVVWEILQQASCDGSDILLADSTEALLLKGSTQSPEFCNRLQLRRGVGLAGAAYVSQKAIYLGKDAGKDPRFAHAHGLFRWDFESCAVVPLKTSESRLGVLFFEKRTQWKFTEAAKKKLERIANLVAIAIEGFKSAYDNGVSGNPIGLASEVSKIIGSSPYLEEILQLLVNQTGRQFNYPLVTLRLLSESSNELILRASYAVDRAYQRKRAVPLDETIAGRAIAEGAPVVVKELQNEEADASHDLAADRGFESMICVPLKVSNRIIGVMSCYTDILHEFKQEEVRALETLCQQAAFSIEHAKLTVRPTLMQEMHHRVKNNLQQVAALLRLQLRHSRDLTLEEAIDESLLRVQAIAAVHDLLSREDLDHVGIRSIAETLLQHSQHLLKNPGRTIEIETRGDDPRLNVTKATQVALILNELISNSIEHGFKEATEGAIHLNIEEGDEQIKVWVSNSGDKLPEEFDVAVASDLGLKIVENLTRALAGVFVLEDRLGWTVAELTIPKESGD
jgi:two-component sensor histidine kinase